MNMDQKKSPNRRSKRQSKLAEDSYWDCSVCTYRNTAEAFKCLMCDTRKGTSTRKPRINTQLVAQQVAQQYTQLLPKAKKEGLPMPKSELGMSMAVGSPLPEGTATLPVVSTTGGGVGMAAALPGGGAGGNSSTGGGIGGNSGGGIATVTKSSTKPEKRHCTHGESKTTSRKARPKLKNVDRSSAQHKAVTVNNVTVIITEFQPKRHQSSSASSENNHIGPPSSGGPHGHSISHHHPHRHNHVTTNGCGPIVENGIHSDSTNLSNDSHSDGRSS